MFTVHNIVHNAPGAYTALGPSSDCEAI